ncbi:BON domain-containing protein [Rubrivivax sp. RP6-9]|uniref:BON domain-containing protein n=1 Tax=Rubrivivax sp. RP6-9 TaxID=3415750 RepID=UPI003CC6A876
MRIPTSRPSPGAARAALLALTAAAAVALSACNKAPDAPPAAPPAPTTMGTQIDDAGVTGRVKAALLAAPDVKSADISVLTVQGEVQLSGILDNQAQIDQVVQIARAADGVTGVKNELRIKQ